MAQEVFIVDSELATYGPASAIENVYLLAIPLPFVEFYHTFFKKKKKSSFSPTIRSESVK